MERDELVLEDEPGQQVRGLQAAVGFLAEAWQVVLEPTG